MPENAETGFKGLEFVFDAAALGAADNDQPKSETAEIQTAAAATATTGERKKGRIDQPSRRLAASWMATRTRW